MGWTPATFKASPEIAEKVRKILESNGITNKISEVLADVNPASLKGAGMASVPSYVTVNFVDSEQKSLHLFLKEHTAVEVHNEMHQSMKLFEKEGRFFTKYVPAITEFCKRKGQESLLNFYPKCFYADDGLIVFENLVAAEYILLNKKERQALEPARVALITLAKHHALSHAFIKDIGGPEEFRKRFPNLDYEGYEGEIVRSFLRPLLENGIATTIKIIEKNDVEGKEEPLAILRAHIGKAFETMMNAIKYVPEEEKLLTLNHGDYWNNNMMFLEDKETNSLHSPVIFDFQITRYNSPAVDIGNFLYTSVKPEVRQNHLEELLRAYHESLLDTSEKLGFPIDFSYDELFNLYRRKFLYGFWFSIWLASDASYEVINDVEHSEGAEASDWSAQFDKKVQQWIDANPEKSKKDAIGLVKFVNEYLKLTRA